MAFADFIRTFTGEIFANDAYKLSSAFFGNVSMFTNEPNVKYTIPCFAESIQVFSV